MENELFNLAERITWLEKMYNQTLSYLNSNISNFLTVTIGVIGLAGVGLVFIAKQLITSGVEKGIREIRKEYDEKISTIEKTMKNHENRLNGLIESGNNVNGSYIKFADGTQICSQKINIEYEDYKGLFSKHIVFPAYFTSNVIISLSLEENLHKTESYKKYINYSNLTNSGVTIIVRSERQQQDDIEEVSIIAIGRWK